MSEERYPPEGAFDLLALLEKTEAERDRYKNALEQIWFSRSDDAADWDTVTQIAEQALKGVGDE
jgi:hypothetical protein